jgi:hypothetical protein
MRSPVALGSWTASASCLAGGPEFLSTIGDHASPEPERGMGRESVAGSGVVAAPVVAVVTEKVGFAGDSTGGRNVMTIWLLNLAPFLENSGEGVARR